MNAGTEPLPANSTVPLLSWKSTRTDDEGSLPLALNLVSRLIMVFVAPTGISPSKSTSGHGVEGIPPSAAQPAATKTASAASHLPDLRTRQG